MQRSGDGFGRREESSLPRRIREGGVARETSSVSFGTRCSPPGRRADSVRCWVVNLRHLRSSNGNIISDSLVHEEVRGRSLNVQAVVLPSGSRHLKGIVMRKLVVTTFLSMLMATVIATVAYSYTITHPDLKNAHDLAEQAIKQVEGAQHTEATGGVDFGGHANKAISLFTEAQKELAAADEYNNSHQKKAKPKQ